MRYLALALFSLACSSDPDDEFATACEANTVRECGCPDDTVASQICADDGSKWGECSCAPPPEACRRDADCTDSDYPACIDGGCVEPTWVAGGGDCSDAASRCGEELECQPFEDTMICVVVED